MADPFEGLDRINEWQEELYVHFHKNPELSMAEKETAAEITRRLESFGYQTHQIGGGVVGLLDNGDGPTVLFRADIDALPVEEDTGLPYSSEVPGVMHACGHDFHITSGLGTAALLAENRDSWSGTYVALFQPGEETAEGARAMVDDGLVGKVPRPDVALSQHVLTKPAAGEVATASGPVLSTAASMKVVVYGKGSHGSMPHLGIDPVVLASAIVMRLQGIVSREIAPSEFGVVTVGSLQAGSKANIIPDRAELRPHRSGEDRSRRRRPQHPRIGSARGRHRGPRPPPPDHRPGPPGFRGRLHHAVDHGPPEGLLGRAGPPAGRLDVVDRVMGRLGSRRRVRRWCRRLARLAVDLRHLHRRVGAGVLPHRGHPGEQARGRPGRRLRLPGADPVRGGNPLGHGDPHLRTGAGLGQPDGHRPRGPRHRVVLLLHPVGTAANEPVHRPLPLPEHDLHRRHDLELPPQLHHRDSDRQPAVVTARRSEGGRQRLHRLGRRRPHHRLRRIHHRVHPGRREAPAALRPPQASSTNVPRLVFGEKLLQRFGPRKPMVWGSLIVIVSIGLLMQTELLVGHYVVLAVIAYCLFGLGLAFYATPSTDAALSNLPGDKAGSGSGIYKMASSLGSAMGAAVSLAVFTAMAGTPSRLIGDVIEFQGRTDNLALRQAAMVALGVNLIFVILAILSIVMAVPKGGGSRDLGEMAESPAPEPQLPPDEAKVEILRRLAALPLSKLELIEKQLTLQELAKLDTDVLEKLVEKHLE